jgi:hypothetical protein
MAIWASLMNQRGMTARAATVLTLGAISCLAAPPAWAQPSAEDKALATALFKEARGLLSRNEIAKACRKFQESHRIDPSGGTLLNLAACHEKLGRTASAWTEYNEALALARRDNRDDRIRFAAEHMQAIEPRLSHIIVEVPQSAQLEGLEIRRDGSVLHRAAWGSRMPVDPGTHVIEAGAKGYRAWRSEFSIDADGVQQRVVIPVLVPLPTSDNRDDPVDDVVGPEKGQRPGLVASSDVGPVPWPAYVLGGVGVVSLGIGSYFGLRAFSKDREADEACKGGTCSSDGVTLTNEAGEAADISTLAFAVGIVAVGSGVTVWLLDRDGPPSSSHVAPTVGPNQAGMSWSGRF